MKKLGLGVFSLLFALVALSSAKTFAITTPLPGSNCYEHAQTVLQPDGNTIVDYNEVDCVQGDDPGPDCIVYTDVNGPNGTVRVADVRNCTHGHFITRGEVGSTNVPALRESEPEKFAYVEENYDEDGEYIGGAGEEAAQADNTCEDQGGVMGWVLCPMVSMLDSVLDFVDRQIEALLEVDQNKYTNEGLRGAWETIRNISYIILIPIMLVMVIGTALGFEIFSAYTIKKALPRMVIAVIFITFSWYICQFLIGFSNVVGSGVSGLITSPFREQMPASCQQGNLSLSCLFDVPGGAGITGGILHGILLLPQYALTFIGALVILVFFGWTLLLVVGTAMLILLARQMFIIALMMLAPLAILAWIFPGNDKLWKSWWNIFTKLLMMFPLIMLILAMGKIFAHLINLTGGAGLDGAVLGPIMKLAAYMLPYAFIPFAFKFAGGVFANVAGIINDKEKGLFDRAKQSRAEKFKRAGENRFFNPNGKFGKFNSAMSWVGDPKSNARIALRMPSGRAIMGQVTQGAFEHTQKLSEVLSRIGMNDVALRGLSTGVSGYDRNGNARSVVAWNGTEKDLDRVANELEALYTRDGQVDENARLAGKQLRDNGGFMLTAFKSEDYGRGSFEGAAGLSLAQQGFITPSDIAQISNDLDERLPGMGSMFKTSAELLGARGGALTKPGYTVQLNTNGAFREGDFRTRVSQATRIGTQDWGGAKGSQIDANFSDAIQGILSGEVMRQVNSRGEVEEVLRITNPTTGEVITIDPGLQRTVEDTLLQTYSSYTAPDVRNRVRRQLVNAEVARGATQEQARATVEGKLARYGRGVDIRPDEILRGQAPPEPPPGQQN